MRKLSKIESVIFMVGGALMVVSVGCFVFRVMPAVMSWLFLTGAILFAVMQARQWYSGKSFVIRRLRRIMLTADVLFVVAGLLMVESHYHFAQSWFDWFTYVKYVNNNWVVVLLIAAILEMYSIHRISSELVKENDDKELKN